MFRSEQFMLIFIPRVIFLENYIWHKRPLDQSPAIPYNSKAIVRARRQLIDSSLLVPSGNFSFYSYRDPEASRNTPLVFNNSTAWLLDANNFKSEHVEEAKLSIFKTVDSPTAPGDRGMTAFLSGVDLEMLQKHRRAVMTVRTDDVLRVAAKYLDHRENPLTIASSLIGPPSSDLDDSWQVLSG
jgi:hypothetical protein